MNNNKLEKGKYKAISVAKYLFSLDPKREYFTNRRIKNKITFRTTTLGRFRLHQVLYLLQILHYLKYNKPLLTDKFYAWENGVIVYNVYTHFWELYHGLNGKDIKEIDDKETKEFIDRCFNYLKTISERELQEFSYNDPAWSSTWTRSEQPEIHFINNLAAYQSYCSHWLQEIRL